MKTAWIAAVSLFFAYTASAANDCKGIDVLYPKEGTSFSKEEQQTIYLILGNKVHNAKLKEITVPRGSNDGPAKKMETNGIENLSKVAVFQLDMNQLDGALPDNFSFRIEVDQDGQECTYESPSFEVTN
ncbi:hypothetical protein BJV82DRAFT_608931 [Fennellomyces sp. T-0311]|nr:hypothetical protein BJV82DRAFT_608931 [Fennellomyces sp. T-0311]